MMNNLPKLYCDVLPKCIWLQTQTNEKSYKEGMKHWSDDAAWNSRTCVTTQLCINSQMTIWSLRNWQKNEIGDFKAFLVIQ